MAIPSRWFLSDYHHAWVGPELRVVVTTDVPCHLWLYWTLIPTRLHMRSDFDSGVGWYWEPKFCFVESNMVEQDEPGDTLEHHFKFGGWAHCLTRWWLFVGEVAGNRSPSVSPIFHAHYMTYQEDESMRHTDLTDKEVAGVIDHADGSITPAKLRDPLWVPIEHVEFSGIVVLNFAAIPATFSLLKIMLNVGTNFAGVRQFYIRFNEDSFLHYNYRYISLSAAYASAAMATQQQGEVARLAGTAFRTPVEITITTKRNLAKKQWMSQAPYGMSAMTFCTGDWTETIPEINHVRLWCAGGALIDGWASLSGLLKP